MVVTLGQQYNAGQKPSTVILYQDQLKASTTMDLGTSIFLISVQCVALRYLDLLIQTGWSVIFSYFC